MMTNPDDPIAAGQSPGPDGAGGSAGYRQHPGPQGGGQYPGQQPQQSGPYTGGPYAGSGWPPPQQQWQPGPGQQPQWQGGPGGQPGPVPPVPGQQWQQGGFPPGHGAVPPKKKTGRVVVIVAAGAVVLAGVGVGIAAAVGAFSSSAEQQIEENFTALFTAVNAGDGRAILSGPCAAEREDLEDYIADTGLTVEEFYAENRNDATISVDVTDVAVDGDRATVTFDGTLDWGDGDVDTDRGETETMVKEDGVWKLC